MLPLYKKKKCRRYLLYIYLYVQLPESYLTRPSKCHMIITFRFPGFITSVSGWISHCIRENFSIKMRKLIMKITGPFNFKMIDSCFLWFFSNQALLSYMSFALLKFVLLSVSYEISNIFSNAFVMFFGNFILMSALKILYICVI